MRSLTQRLRSRFNRASSSAAPADASPPPYSEVWHNSGDTDEKEVVDSKPPAAPTATDAEERCPNEPCKDEEWTHGEVELITSDSEVLFVPLDLLRDARWVQQSATC
jgi:hypothetical protein